MNRLFAAVLLSAAVSAHADPLTLEGAIDLALRNNLGLQSQNRAADVKRAQETQAIGRLLPQIQVQGGGAWLNAPENNRVLGAVVPRSPGVPATLIYGEPEALSAIAGLSFQWTFNPALLEQIRQAEQDWRMSRISYEQARKQVVSGVRKAYYSLFVLQETIRLTELQLANAEERLRQITALSVAGRASELTLLQGQIVRDQLKPTLEGYRQSYQQTLLAFENTLGLERDLSLPLAGLPALPDLTWAESSVDDLLRQYGVQNTGLRLAIGQAELLTRQLTALDASLWPSLALQYTMDPAFNDPLGRDWTDISLWKQSKGALALQLVWKLDSFLPSSTYWTNRSVLESQLAIARNQITQSQRDLAASTENLVDAIRRSQRNRETWSRVVVAADQVLALVEKQFLAGTKNQIDVNDAVLTSQGAHLSLLSSQQSLYTSAWDLIDLIEIPVSTPGAIR